METTVTNDSTSWRSAVVGFAFMSVEEESPSAEKGFSEPLCIKHGLFLDHSKRLQARLISVVPSTNDGECVVLHSDKITSIKGGDITNYSNDAKLLTLLYATSRDAFVGLGDYSVQVGVANNCIFSCHQCLEYVSLQLLNRDFSAFYQTESSTKIKWYVLFTHEFNLVCGNSVRLFFNWTNNWLKQCLPTLT